MPGTCRKSFPAQAKEKALAESKTEKAQSKELAKQLFSSEELHEISSFDDALKLAAEKFGHDNIALASDVIGDGFKLLESKDQLIGTQILLLSWDFYMGDHGEFAAIRVVTRDGRKLVVNDGSSGIRDQLMAYEAKTQRKGGLLVEKGFRRSDYEYEDEKGQKKPATTYYLDLSV